jgi:hypothetical protein
MRDERVVVVFVASPSDLEPERNRLEEVIRELNVTWSRKSGVRFDLVRWETHGYPGVGKDAQDVLNNQLPNDYDIFVGMMWGKFGTPTGRAGSGTEEEYIRAFERSRMGSDRVKVMFYFKNAPLPPDSIDPRQLEKVQNFKRSLGAEGTLHWSFDSLDAFERFIRIHLSRLLQESAPFQDRRPISATAVVGEEIGADDEDVGLLDLLDVAEEHLSENTQILARMTAETETLGKKLEERAKDLTLAKERAQGELDRHSAKILIERAAADLNHFVVRIRAELPLFRQSLLKGVETSARASLMGAEMNQADRAGAQAAATLMASLAATLADAQSSITEFKLTTRGIPRMTSSLNRAKRETAELLDEIVKSMAEGRSLLLEAAKSIEALVGRNGGASPNS